MKAMRRVRGQNVTYARSTGRCHLWSPVCDRSTNRSHLDSGTTLQSLNDRKRYMSTVGRFSLDLAGTLTRFLHVRHDLAQELASIIVAARQRLIQPGSMPQASSTTIMNDATIDDRCSINSGMSTFDDSDSLLSDSTDHQRNSEDLASCREGSKQVASSALPPGMARTTAYLSNVDWRVFHHITTDFMRHGQ